MMPALLSIHGGSVLAATLLFALFQTSRRPLFTRDAIVTAVREAYPGWQAVKDDGGVKPSGWWRFRSEEQDVYLGVSVYPTPLDAAHALEQQNRFTQIGGSCLAWPGDDGTDYSRCNGAVLRLRTGSVVYQVDVWAEGGCDPERYHPTKARRARAIADNLAARLDVLIRTRAAV